MSNKAIIGGGANGPTIIDLDPKNGGELRTVILDQNGGIQYEEKVNANAQEKDGQEDSFKEGGQEKVPIREEKSDGQKTEDEVSSDPSSGDAIVSEIVT